MLVLAPAACITSGIALSEAFDVFTRSIKFQLPNLFSNSPSVCTFVHCPFFSKFVMTFVSFY